MVAARCRRKCFRAVLGANSCWRYCSSATWETSTTDFFYLIGVAICYDVLANHLPEAVSITPAIRLIYSP